MNIDGHFKVSMVKSILRIAAGANLMLGGLLTAGILLVAAEILGIAEELV